MGCKFAFGGGGGKFLNEEKSDGDTLNRLFRGKGERTLINVGEVVAKA